MPEPSRDTSGLAELLERLATGRDPAAWEAFAERTGHDLQRACVRVAGSSLGADASQEALVRIRDRAHRFVCPTDGDVDRAAWGWARRIAVTTALELLRAEARSRARERLAEHRRPTTEDPGERCLADEQAMIVRREIAALPVAQSEAVSLHYLLQLPFTEVAAAQGVTVASAKKRAQRGAATLRVRLSRLGVALAALPDVLQRLVHCNRPPTSARCARLHQFSAPLGVVKGITMFTAMLVPIVVVAFGAQSGPPPSPLPVGTVAPGLPATAASYPEVTIALDATSLIDALVKIGDRCGWTIRLDAEPGTEMPWFDDRANCALHVVADRLPLDVLMTSLQKKYGLRWRPNGDHAIVLSSRLATKSGYVESVEEARLRRRSMENMRQIYTACLSWAAEHAFEMPPDIDTVVRAEELPPNIQHPAGSAGVAEPHYCFVRPMNDARSTTPVLVENMDLRPHRLLIVFCDAHVEAFTEDDLDIQSVWDEARRLASTPAAAQDGVSHSAWSIHPEFVGWAGDPRLRELRIDEGSIDQGPSSSEK